MDLTYSDDYTENQLVARVLKLVLNDENGEVKNAAVSWSVAIFIPGQRALAYTIRLVSRRWLPDRDPHL